MTDVYIFHTFIIFKITAEEHIDPSVKWDDITLHKEIPNLNLCQITPENGTENKMSFMCSRQ